MLNENEYQEWRALPATKSFFAYLNACREEAKEAWALSVFSAESPTVEALKNARALGGVVVYQEIIQLAYEDLASDEEYIGDVSP